MKLNLEEVSQIKQTWSDVIPESGCNIESCRAIVQDLTGKKISSESFYAKLLKNDIIREGPSDDGYIRDYYQMLEVFGLHDVTYQRTFDLNETEIKYMLDGGIPLKAMVKTKGGTHFTLICGYGVTPESKNLFFHVIDPMERDSFLNPYDWYFYNKDWKRSPRKLKRIEWFMKRSNHDR